MRDHRPTLLAVDWGKETSKRAAFISRPDGRGYRIEPLPPPPDGHRVRTLLEIARRETDRSGAAVLIGIDAVIGAPRRYLESWQSARSDAPPGFLSLLREVGRSPELLDQGSAESWSPNRPFFAVPKGERGLTRVVEQAGGRDVLWRGIDGRTAAKSPFVLSGIPGTVGSGTRELWRELAPLVSASSREFALWPFETSLNGQLEEQGVVVCEVYPRAMYSVVLGDELPGPRVHIAKTKAGARLEALRRLSDVRWLKESGVDVQGIEAAADDEDVFDAMMTALAMVRLALLDRLGESRFADRHCEGDILGLGALDLDAKVIVINGGGAASTPSDMPPVREVRLSPLTRSASARRSPARKASVEIRCPIPGCDHVFLGGRGGWDAHVGSYGRHPEWRRDLRDAGERKAAFRLEYRSWFS